MSGNEQISAPARLGRGLSLGKLTLALLVSQAVTGALLALHYEPGMTSGHQSVLEIQRLLSMGWVLRGLHRYTAYAIVILAFLHMFSIFFRRAYQKDYVGGWLVGNLFNLLILGAVFTGVLLPLDVTAGCATRVALSLISLVPIAGRPLAALLFGFNDVGSFDPTRFYFVHVSLLPMLMLGLAWVHRGRGRGVLGERPGKVLGTALGLTLLVLIYSSLRPPELGRAFDPAIEVVKDVHPVWVFMSAYLLVGLTSRPGPWLSLLIALYALWIAAPLFERRYDSVAVRRAVLVFGALVAAALALGTLLAYPLTGGG